MIAKLVGVEPSSDAIAAASAHIRLRPGSALVTVNLNYSSMVTHFGKKVSVNRRQTHAAIFKG